jgi:guanine deaminase
MSTSTIPKIRILGALGYSLLDWLEKQALPEEAKFADPDYAQGVAWEFVRALLSHGTTTALVFGSHFAQATALLFAAARKMGLRIVSGLVLSETALASGPACQRRDCLFGKPGTDTQISRAGKCAVCSVAPVGLSTPEALLEFARRC